MIIYNSRTIVFDKIRKTYAMLGLIKRNFNLLSRDSFVMLYKTMVRSHLEYANTVWNPYRERLIKDLERVEIKETKLESRLRKKSYNERLLELKLPTLKYRRMRRVYKLLTNKYDDNTVHLHLNTDTRTRGHTKLVVKRCHYDVQKYSFCNKVVNIWNSLPNDVNSCIHE